MKNILLGFCFSLSAIAQQAFTFPFVPNQPPIPLALPDGYSLREIDGIQEDVFIFCPWNEYFSIHPFRYQRSGSQPVKDEISMMAELDSFAQANPRLFFQKKKVWMTTQGPRGSMEIAEGEKDKATVGVYLVVPYGQELLVLTTMGLASSANDQRLVHDLFNQALRLPK